MIKNASMLSNGDGVAVNKSEAARYLKMSADNGNEESMIKYASMLSNGDGIAVNKSEAACYLKMSADNGNEESMIKYTTMLILGDGIAPNIRKAAPYMKLLLDKEVPSMLFLYGQMLETGNGVKINKEKAIQYYKMAADKGHEEAKQKYLSLINNMTDVIDEKDINNIKKKVDEGNPEAVNLYGLLLYKGELIECNKEEAFLYFAKSAQKENIHGILNTLCIIISECEDDNTISEFFSSIPLSSMNMKFMNPQHTLLYSEGIPNDISIIQYIKMSADKGNLCAIIFHARLLLTIAKSPQELKKSAYYFKIAADKGDVMSMKKYASMALNGIGIPVNKHEAAKYYKIAADQGNEDAKKQYFDLLSCMIYIINREDINYIKKNADEGNSDALNLYGLLLFKGKLINCKKQEALLYFKQSADKSNINGLINYVCMFISGQNVQIPDFLLKKGCRVYYPSTLIFSEGIPDNIDVYEYMKMSADKGNLFAIILHAHFMGNNAKSSQDIEESIRYFKIAADQGNTYAMKQYALMLIKNSDKGYGNKQEVIHYIKMAADNGDDEAIGICQDCGLLDK